MLSILILMNCLGSEIENYFLNIPEIKDFYSIKHIISFENLENTAIFDDIRNCDILIINNIKQYEKLTYDNLKTIVKPSAKICKVEFIRFNGYYPVSYYGHSNGLMVYDESTTSDNFNDYKHFFIQPEIIQTNFKESLEKLKRLDSQSDIKFYDYFIKTHIDTMLFRDSEHLTHTFLKYIVKEILQFLNISTSISVESLSLDYTDSYYFRVKPILNCVKNELGLKFDTSTVNLFNKDITIEEYYKFIKESTIYTNIEDTKHNFNKIINYIMIPIIIICYNNYKYVDNTIKQIANINNDYIKNIIILNNCSTCEDTINYLKNINCHIINNPINNGPWISSERNIHMYQGLPNKFILTDPDLEFNPNLPKNFIEVLSEYSDKYCCYKIGFALDISDFDKMYQSKYSFIDKTIYEGEIGYWNNKIYDDKYELYNAPIDTTFCLVNKLNEYKTEIRMGGIFTAKHLPWYINNKIYTAYENYILCLKSTNISTISKIIIEHFESNNK